MAPNINAQIRHLLSRRSVIYIER